MLPVDCPDGLSGVNLGILSGTTNLSEYQRFCEPECFNVVVNYYEECLGEVVATTATFYRNVCSTGANGIKCYSQEVVKALQSLVAPCGNVFSNDFSCTEACKNTVELVLGTVGCCVYVADGGGTNGTAIIEQTCQVAVPQTCSAHMLKAVATFVAVSLAVFMLI